MIKSFPVFSLFLSSIASAQPFDGPPTPNDTLKPVRALPTNQVVLSLYAPKAWRRNLYEFAPLLFR